MVKNTLLALALLTACGVQAMNQLPQAAVDLASVATDLVSTGSQFNFIQEMLHDLHKLAHSLEDDRKSFQGWNMTLVQMLGNLSMHEQQYNYALNQVRNAVNQLLQILANHDHQDQQYIDQINALTQQLIQLQHQTDLEIMALQKQLDDTTLELDMLEEEYGDFVDATFAHLKALYNMLQLVKREYAALICERTEFFSTLQVLTTALEAHENEETEQLYDLLSTITSAQK